MKLANKLQTNESSEGKVGGSSRSLVGMLSPRRKSRSTKVVSCEDDDSFNGLNGLTKPRGGSECEPKSSSKKIMSPPLTPSAKKSSAPSIMSKMYDYTRMVEFMWNEEATSVAIKASWCELPSQLIPLERITKNYHVINTEVPEGKHKYYFIVDGKKKFDPKGQVTTGPKITNQLIVVDPKKAARKAAVNAGFQVR